MLVTVDGWPPSALGIDRLDSIDLVASDRPGYFRAILNPETGQELALQMEDGVRARLFCFVVQERARPGP